MTEETLLLLDRATRVPGVMQAFLVTGDRVVYSAASQGHTLADDETWLMVADHVAGLAHFRIEADTYRWTFGETTLVVQKGSSHMFGAVVKPTSLEETTARLQRRFKKFLIQLNNPDGASESHP